MFTGLVEEVATVERITYKDHSAHLRIRADKVLDDISIGDSIAVNGVCLTVVAFDKNGFLADAVPETMRRTNLGKLRPGHPVNLERALMAGARFGGHIVSGHVDGVGILQRIDIEGIAHVLTISVEQDLIPYIADKGSICVDGVSLTVMDTTDKGFRVSIIPHTGQATILLNAKPGAWLNLECDVLAKYVEKLLFTQRAGNAGRVSDGTSGALAVSSHLSDALQREQKQTKAGVNEDLLRRTGFL